MGCMVMVENTGGLIYYSGSVCFREHCLVGRTTNNRLIAFLVLAEMPDSAGTELMSNTAMTTQGVWFFVLSSILICLYAFVRFRQSNPALEQATGVAVPYKLTTVFGFSVAASIYVGLFYMTCLIPALIPDILEATFGILGKNLDDSFVQWRSYTLMLSLFLVLTLMRTRVGDEVDSVLRKVLIQLPIGPTIPDLLAEIRTSPLFLEEPIKIPLFRDKITNSDLLNDADFDANADAYKLRWIRSGCLVMMLREMEDKPAFTKFYLARKERIEDIYGQFENLCGHFRTLVGVEGKLSDNDEEFKELVETYRQTFTNNTDKLITEIYRLFAFTAVKFWTAKKRTEILRDIGFVVQMSGGPLVRLNKLMKTLIFVFLALFLVAPIVSPFLVDAYEMLRSGQSGFGEMAKIIKNFDVFGVWAVLIVVIHIPIVLFVVGGKRKVLFDHGQFWAGMKPGGSDRPWSLYLVASFCGGIYGSIVIYLYTVATYYLAHGDLLKSAGDGLPSLLWFCVPLATAASVAYLSDRQARPTFQWIPDWCIQATWTMLAAGISSLLSVIAMSARGVQPIERPIGEDTLWVYIFVATGLIGAVIGAIIPKEMRANQERYLQHVPA